MTRLAPLEADDLPGPGAIDGTKPFIPEPLTPLWHTPIHATLTERERLRYNQLHAVYANEQILFFEKTLAKNILTAILREALPDPLATSLRTFLDDEAAHTRMFRRLNRRSAPDLYTNGDFYFVRVSAPARGLLGAASRHPHTLPLFLWLMLLLEERAIHYARQILRARAMLEPHFVAVHQRHLQDEIHHIRWDQAMLDLVWRTAPPRRRKVNALLFRWMVGEFFNAPKRAGVRVVEELARQCPELGARLPEMRRQLRALARRPTFHRSLYSRTVVPRTFAGFDAWPELHGLRRVLPGYEPWPPPR